MVGNDKLLGSRRKTHFRARAVERNELIIVLIIGPLVSQSAQDDTTLPPYLFPWIGHYELDNCGYLPSFYCFERIPVRLFLAFSHLQDLRAAAQDREIQAALETKVSRERVGAELCGMLTGKVLTLLAFY